MLKCSVNFRRSVLTLHAHVPLEGGFPEPVTVILPALVMSCVILGLGHTKSRFSETAGLLLMEILFHWSLLSQMDVNRRTMTI